MPIANTTLFSIVLLLFTLSQAAAQKNFDYYYNPEAEIKVNNRYTISNTEAVVWLGVVSSKGNQPYHLDYQYIGTSKTIIVSDSLTINESQWVHNEGFHLITLKIPHKNESGLLLISLTGKTGKTWLFDIPIVINGKLHHHQLIPYLTKKDIPVLKPYISLQDSIKVKSFNPQVRQLHFYHYPYVFEPATPPMADASAAAAKEMNIDSVFTVPNGTSLKLSKEGLYFVQSDSSSLNGLTLRAESPSFPKPNTLESLVAPLVYITTRSEKAKLKRATEDKQKFDKFWIELTRSKERAKEIIKNYYRRVRQANELFTSYKEGWKTDMGMIYIIYGSPDKVLRYGNKEEWYYNETQYEKKLMFSFTKIDNIFTRRHFTLTRNPKYKNAWFRAVDLWRKGRHK